jgi:hypothetical protein
VSCGLDASGAVVAGAHLKVRNVSTSFTASTTTDNQGLFRFAILPVGLYELTADHAGFATIQVNKIDLTVGASLTLTLRFSVAGAKAAQELYHSASELPDAERRPFLQRACGEDQGLRLELESLLRHGNTPQSFLDTAAIAVQTWQHCQEGTAERTIAALSERRGDAGGSAGAS